MNFSQETNNVLESMMCGEGVYTGPNGEPNVDYTFQNLNSKINSCSSKLEAVTNDIHVNITKLFEERNDMFQKLEE